MGRAWGSGRFSIFAGLLSTGRRTHWNFKFGVSGGHGIISTLEDHTLSTYSDGLLLPSFYVSL